MVRIRGSIPIRGSNYRARGNYCKKVRSRHWGIVFGFPGDFPSRSDVNREAREAKETESGRPWHFARTKGECLRRYRYLHRSNRSVDFLRTGMEDSPTFTAMDNAFERGAGLADRIDAGMETHDVQGFDNRYSIVRAALKPFRFVHAGGSHRSPAASR